MAFRRASEQKARARFRKDDYVHINLDTLKSRNKEMTLLMETVEHGLDFVVDNTNPTGVERKRYIDIARRSGYREIHCYFFQSRVGDCIRRNSLREGAVPDKAIAVTSNRLELPSRDEGFTEMFFVSIAEGRFEAPFDKRFNDLMVDTVKALLTDTGMKIVYGYTESDEISLLFSRDADTFGKKVRKLNTILAGTASAVFSLALGRPAVFDCRIVLFPNTDLVVDYFRWRMEDCHRNCLNSWCYWTLRKDGMDADQASGLLSGKSVAYKNDFLFQRGINFNDLPIWQRRGVGIYWRDYEKKGHNPVTGEDVTVTRREVYADYGLAKDYVPLGLIG